MAKPDEEAGPARETSFWLRELPYLLIIILGLVGISWTSISRSPSTTYWEFVTPVVALICIWSGWDPDETVRGQVKMIVSQILHWGAVLVAMALLLTTSMRGMLNADSISLTLLTLLALGVFTAGLSLWSWRLSVCGAFLGLAVPLIAWVQRAALLLFLIAIAVAAVVFAVEWFRARRASETV